MQTFHTRGPWEARSVIAVAGHRFLINLEDITELSDEEFYGPGEPADDDSQEHADFHERNSLPIPAPDRCAWCKGEASNRPDADEATHGFCVSGV
jgi:hypothetical protein